MVRVHLRKEREVFFYLVREFICNTYHIILHKNLTEKYKDETLVFSLFSFIIIFFFKAEIHGVPRWTLSLS